MINFYIDLDDVVFDFSRDFAAFVNARYNKTKIVIPDNPYEFTEITVFGMEKKKFMYLLGLYIEAGRFAIQPLISGAAKFLRKMAESGGKPNFITVRDPESVMHTMSRLQDLYHLWGVTIPYTAFRLHIANSKHHRKWQIINELGRFAPKGIFIDDCPAYINDVVKNCPGVITIWMNTLNIMKNDCDPHFEVSTWAEIHTLINNNSFEELTAKSARPGVQERLTI